VTTPAPNPITQLLAAAGQGDQAARDRLWSAIYDELHRLAQHELAGENPARSPQPTSLVHETYLRLVGNDHIEWANRRHFFAVAAKAMRYLRREDGGKRKRLKRGGGARPRPLHEESVPDPQRGWGTPGCDPDPAEVLAIDEALSKLEQTDPRKAEVVMLRYFAGLTGDETAAAMELSPRTVDSEWRFAKAWLHRELTK